MNRQTPNVILRLASIPMALLVAGCSDRADVGCTSDADCREGRMCIASVCAEPDEPAVVDDDASARLDGLPR